MKSNSPFIQPKKFSLWDLAQTIERHLEAKGDKQGKASGVPVLGDTDLEALWLVGNAGNDFEAGAMANKNNAVRGEKLRKEGRAKVFRAITLLHGERPRSRLDAWAKFCEYKKEAAR